jgi:RNA polymerase sigma factor (sigma-70 family)
MQDTHEARRALRRYARLRSTLHSSRSPLSTLGRAKAPRGSRRVGLEDALAEMIDLEAALSRLLPIERELLVLVHVFEMTQSQAAMLLGISLRTVGRRLRQALEEYENQLSQ